MSHVLEAHHSLFDGGAQPSTTGHALTLESKRPVSGFEARSLRHESGSLAGLRLVWVALGNGTLGDAVGSEDDGNLRLHLLTGSGPRSPEHFRKSFHQQWMDMPRLDERQGKRGSGFTVNRLAVEPDTGARILRSQADGDDLLHPIRRNLPNNVGDERLPVPHGHVYGKADFAGENFSLAGSDFVQWRMADARIAVLHFFEHVGRDRAAARDMAQVLGDIVDGVGGAMREEKDGLLHLFTAASISQSNLHHGGTETQREQN